MVRPHLREEGPQKEKVVVGQTPEAAAAPAPAMPPMTWRTPFTTLREVSAHRTFWILAGTFFICGLSTNGLVQTHFISLCGDNGLSAVPAASVLANPQ